MTRTMTVLMATAFLLTGCATVKEHDQLNKPTGRDLETFVGGSVFKINKSRDLPNAFGGADIFGGKVFAGYTEVRFQGVNQSGGIVFRITEMETQSNETTMSRYGRSSAQFNGRTSPSGNVYGTVDVNHPPQGSTTILPPNTTEVSLNPAVEKDLTVAGVTVTVVEASTQKLRYRLTKPAAVQ